MLRRHFLWAWLAASLTIFASLASASETIVYIYDAQGRLINVAHSGAVNNGVAAAYTFDNADNRTNVTVTGAGAGTPSFSIGNASVTEGGTATFTVTKTGSASGTLTVNYVTANDTASAGSDYTAASNTLTFVAGDNSETISIATSDDAVVESTETFTVTLSGNSAGSTIGTATGTGTINDNDGSAPSFAIADVTTPVAEGSPIVFTVTKTGSGAANVTYASANGSATSGSDYTVTSGTLVFASGDISKTITVPTLADSVSEGNETVLMNLSAPTGGATISDNQGTGTISNVAASAFGFGTAPTATEGNTITFTVTKSAGAAANVNYATANGTATAGSDYTTKSGTLSFGAGASSQTIVVTTLNNATVESNETVLMNLSGATGGATITTSQQSGTITDNDISFAFGTAPAVTEGSPMVFTITKTGNFAGSVTYATANGTATAGSDYTAKSATVLSFAAGDTSKTVSVTTIDDSATESNETILLNLTAATPSSDATITTAQQTGTINDNDSLISITDSNFNVLPAHASTYNCIETVILGNTVQNCYLPNMTIVYQRNGAGVQTFDPGYSMVTTNVLRVASASYGTGVSP